MNFGTEAIDTASCRNSSTPGTCSVQFLSSYNSVQITRRSWPATGNYILTVPGAGFNKNYTGTHRDENQTIIRNLPYYNCTFTLRGGENNLARFEISKQATPVNLTHIDCPIEPWMYTAAANVSLAILGPDLVLDTAQIPAKFRFYQVYSEISIATSSALGGPMLTVTGAGFDSDRMYNCFFVLYDIPNPNLQNGETSPAQVQSSTSMRCPLPAWGGYQFDTHFYLASHDLIFKPEKDETYFSLSMKFFPEWSTHDPVFVDRLGGLNGGRSPAVTVSGQGFNPGFKYQCEWYGSNTRYPTRSNKYLSAEVDAFAKNTKVACVPPAWDSQSAWESFTSPTLVNIAVWQLENGVWSEFYTRNGSLAAGQVPSRFVNINRRPGFVGSNIQTEAGAVESISNWATQIKPGVNEDGSDATHEANQLLTFIVLSLNDAPFSKMFATAPEVLADGTLTFVAGGQSGLVSVGVMLMDNGGILWGGIDRSKQKSFIIEIRAGLSASGSVASAAQQHSNVSVLEGSPQTIARQRFVLNTVSADTVLSVVSYTLNMSDAHRKYFAEGPEILVSGSIVFKPAPYAFGKGIFLLITLVVFDPISAQNSTMKDFAKVSMSIQQVNTAPFFNISDTLVLTERESRCTDSICMFPGFAKDIRTGGFTVQGPQNEDWQETAQTYAFTTTGSSQIFLAQPNMSHDGTLTLRLAPHRSGEVSVTITITDDGGVDNGGVDSYRRVLKIIVQEFNDAPTFQLNCSADADVERVTTCSSACATAANTSAVEDIKQCSVEVRILQNCAGCPSSLPSNCSHRLSLRHFVRDVHPSNYGSVDELNQSLSFEIALLSGDSSIFQLNPRIDTRTGDFSLCLDTDMAGVVEFNVTLVDSGSMVYGETIRYGPALLTVTVVPVNQAPSFRICENSLNPGCEVSDLCCANTLRVWNGGRTLEYPRFAHDILRGNRDVHTAEDIEYMQNVTFVFDAFYITSESFTNGTVHPYKTVDSFFFFHSIPTIDENGTLKADLIIDRYGEAIMTVRLIDNGGYANGGVNTSIQKNITLSLTTNYLSFFMSFAQGMFDPTNTTQRLNVRMIIASALGINPELVVILQYTAPSRRLLQNIDGQVEVQVLGASQQQLDASGQNLAALVTAALQAAGFSNVVVSAPSRFARNADTSTSFEVASDVVVAPNRVYSSSSPYEQTAFVFNVSGPAGTPLDEHGRQIVFFDVIPLRFKPYDGSSTWLLTKNTSDPLLAGIPTVTAICEPVCKTGMLRLATIFDKSGIVEYQVKMRGTSFKLLFQVHVSAVNVPPEFEFSSSEVSNRTVYINEGATLAISDFLINVSAGNHPTDRYFQNVSFTIALLPAAQSVLFSTYPTFLYTPNAGFKGTGTAHLSAVLHPDLNGKLTFAISCHDNGGLQNGGIDTSPNINLEVVVLPVNDPPSFLIPSPMITVLEDSGTTSHLNMITSILRGPVQNSNEDYQDVTFVFMPLSGNITFADGPHVVGHVPGQAGTLVFTPSLDMYGSVVMDVIAVDNGGYERGGLNTSSAVRMTITVDPVNDAPFFSFSVAKMTVWEDSGSHVQLKFVNTISTGPLMLSNEDEQLVSFTLTLVSQQGIQPIVYSETPRIVIDNTTNRTGMLIFTAAPDSFGQEVYHAVLTDNGGNADGGSDTSAAVSFTIEVQRWNDPPSFGLASSGVGWANPGVGIVDENSAPIRWRHFFVNVSNGLGGVNDLEQKLTFVFTHISGDEILFDERPRIVVNGTGGDLYFAPKSDHHGTEVFSVTAFDNGGWSHGSTGQNFSTTLQVTLIVNSVNTPPSFRMISDVFTVQEDSGRYVKSKICDQIMQGPVTVYDRALANEEEQQLTFVFTLAAGSTGMVFVEGPKIDIETILPNRLNYNTKSVIGHLTFTPALDWYGTDIFDVTLQDNGGGANTSVSQQLTIRVLPVNDAPTSVLSTTIVESKEDVPMVMNNFLQHVSNGHEPGSLSNEASQNLTFSITHVSGDRISYATYPHIVLTLHNANANLSFTPSPDFFGEELFNLTVFDDGGGDDFTSNTVFFTVRVLAVNDPPVFELSSSYNITQQWSNVLNMTMAEFSTFEDTARTMPDFVSRCESGPYEKFQEMTFIITHVSGDRMLWTSYPEIMINENLTGTLRFDPGLDWYGEETFNVTLMEDGGTDYGGIDVSVNTIFLKIKILPVNDAPAFDHVPTAIEVWEDSETYEYPNFIYHITRGPRILPNEFTPMKQNVSFVFTQIVGDPGFFEMQPAIQFNLTQAQLNDTQYDTEYISNGTLTFRPAPNVFGDAVFMVVLVDDGGTEYSGENTSSVLRLEISVIAINDAPAFIAPPTLTVCEDPKDPPNYVYINFANNMTAGKFESSQQISFSFAPVSGNVSAFLSGPNMTNEGQLSFEVVPNTYGSAIFDLILSDDGSHGVRDQSTVIQNLTIIFNDRPFFNLPNRLEIFMNETTGTIENYVSDLFLGNPAAQVHAQFVVTPVLSRVPAWHPWKNNNIVGNGSSWNALFSSMSVFVSNSSLNYVLQPDRSGEVLFSVQMINGGGLGCNGALDRTIRNFTVSVLSINSAPRFDMRNDLWTSYEGEEVNVVDFFENIFPGIWGEGESNQKLSFRFEWFAGDRITFDRLGGLCFPLESTDRVDPYCEQGNATLSYLPGPGRYGNMLLRVTLVDNGGIELGGFDNSVSRILNLTILPVNSEPWFALQVPSVIVNQDSRCEGDSSNWVMPALQDCGIDEPYTHVHPVFTEDFSLGTFENGADGCDGLTPCEVQTGKFIVTSLDTTTLTDYMFSIMPHINTSRTSGILAFTLNKNVTGKARFKVVLQDAGALDGTIKTSQDRFFEITVVFHNKAPNFIMAQQMIAYENMQKFSELAAYNISTDGLRSQSEPNQLITFKVEVTHPELFAELPRIFPDGTMQFVSADNIFGNCNVSVELFDDGGKSNYGKDSSGIQIIPLIILPVNNAPTFVLEQDVVTTFENVGGYYFPEFAFQVVPGPPNENCLQEDNYCQVQTVKFIIDDVTNADIFEVKPSFDTTGALAFVVAPHVTGESTVTVRLEDNGGRREQPLYRGTNSSSRHSFKIVVETDTYISPAIPFFNFATDATCLRLEFLNEENGCACPLSGSARDPCGLVNDSEKSVVVFREGSGWQQIKDFMTQLTPADGFFPASTAVFDLRETIQVCDFDFECGPTAVCSGSGAGSRGHCTELAYHRLAADNVLSARGLEYAVDYSISPDGKHAYAVEFETDTLAVFKNGETSERIELIDRRSDKEHRNRFIGFDATVSSFGTPKNVDLVDACGLDIFEADGEVFMAGAGGCDDLQSSLISHAPLENCNGKALASDKYACDSQCCKSAFEGLVGHWDLSSSSAYGPQFVNPIRGIGAQKVECSSSFCTYSRDRLVDGQCDESYATKIGPATFRDLAGKIGSAVIFGPTCKSGSQSDWDKPMAEEKFSVLNFITNNGKEDALMFDGTVSSGLYITDHLQTALRSRLPMQKMTVATWFTISKSTLLLGGLMAVQQEADTCNKGWSLTYTHIVPDSTIIMFKISLQGNVINTMPALKELSVRIVPPLLVGEWNHVAATYDGSTLKIFLNGNLKESVQACANAPCGDIIYPGAHMDLGNCPSTIATPFTIGTYLNSMTFTSAPHKGFIKSVHLLKNALNQPQVGMLYDKLSGILRNSSIVESEYWVRGNNPASGVVTPSKDLMHLAYPTHITLRGRFLIGPNAQNVTYKCEFATISVKHSTIANIGCSNDGTGDPAVCNNGHGDTLICDPPSWRMGYSAAVLTVLRIVDDGTSIRSSELWQRVCLDTVCGFERNRGSRASSWMLKGATKQLLASLVGTKTLIRFATDSSIFVFNTTNESMELQSNEYVKVSNTTNGTLDGSSSSFNNHSHCLSSGCNFDEARHELTAFGLSSVTHFTEKTHACGSTRCGSVCYLDCMTTSESQYSNHSDCTSRCAPKHYLLAANFWDGSNTTVESGVFEFDTASRSVSFMQGIVTHGARRWRHILVNGRTSLLTLASCFGPMRAFYWNSTSSLPISQSAGEISVDIPWCQSDLKTFEINGVTYLVASTFADMTRNTISDISYLFMVGEQTDSTHARFGDNVRELAEFNHTYTFPNPTSSSPVIASMGTFETYAAYAVEHFVLDGVRMLVFASYSSSPSKVFACNASTDQPVFEPLQDLETHFASSALYFQANGSYLVFGQRGNETAMFRWNGTMFQLDLDEYTLPKDVASGDRMLSENATTHAVAYVQMAQMNGLTRCVQKIDAWNGSTSLVVDCPMTQKGYLVLGAQPAVGSNPTTKLHHARREVIQGMAGPVSVQINPIDGKHVYVACRHSRSIVAFDRDPASGVLVHNAEASYLTPWSLVHVNDSYPADDGYQHVTTWGYPLHGIQSILISPDQAHLFATSSLDEALVVFERDNVTGVLTLGTVFRNGETIGGRRVYGLAGAYGLSMSVDGNSIYVSSLNDNALVVIDRKETGNGLVEFSFVDAISSGERLLELYSDVTEDIIPPAGAASSLQDWSSSTFPMRMGGNSEPWSFSARNTYSFIVQSIPYIAVASGEGAPTSTVVGAATIYRWDRSQQRFLFAQKLAENGAPSSFNYIRLYDPEKATDYSFFCVANTHAMNRPSSQGVNVYKRNEKAQTWEFESFLTTPDGNVLDAHVNALKSLQIAGKNYIACAYGQLGVPTVSNSHIYVYKNGVGFRHFQSLPTISATDVQSVVIDDINGQHGFIMFSNLYGDATGRMDTSSVDLYKLNTTTDMFESMQTIPAKGANGMDTFFMPGEGTFLTIANRQDGVPLYDRAYTAYDQAPEIYVWNPEAGVFLLHQRLDDVFKTVLADNAQFAIAISFCSPGCELAADGKNRPVNGLRGSTSVDMFESAGEFYLAIAQSVCEPNMVESECDTFGGQPKSTVLQWNRVSRRFTEMRGITDAFSVSSRGFQLTDEELLGEVISTNAFRVDTRRAFNLKFVEFDNDKFLVISSGFRGAVVLRFEFEELSLNGIVDAEPDATDKFVYVASKIDATLLAFSRTQRYDHVGNAVKSCTGGRCLNFVKILHKEEVGSDNENVQGLRGAARISIIGQQVIVSGKMYRQEMLCGPYPPVSINGNEYSAAPAVCHNLFLTTELISTENPDLVKGLPIVFPNGSLVVELNPKQTGQAVYRTRLTSDHVSKDFSYQRVKPHDLIIQVVQPNQAPLCDTTSVVVDSVTTYIEVKFAENISAGFHEDFQELAFEYSYSNALIFDIPPLLFMRVDESGNRIGLVGYSLKAFVSGEVLFNLTLVDDGESDEATGAKNTSIPRFFKMTILGNNRPPSCEILPELRIVQNSDVRFIELFVTALNAGGGGEENQNLSLSVSTLYTLDGPWPGQSAFDQMHIFQNGTIKIKPAINRFGVFAVEIMLQDDGGTADGGMDQIYRNSTITIERTDPQLVLLSTKNELHITENTGAGDIYDESYTFLSVLSLLGQEYDFRMWDANFEIVSVTNSDLFKTTPELTNDGAVVVSVTDESKIREAEIFVQATLVGRLVPTIFLVSNVVSIQIMTFGVNDPPTFEIPPEFAALEDGGLQEVPMFASYSIGPQDEFWQVISFAVTVESNVARLFTTAPRVNVDGVLTFETFPETHGKAILYIQARDSGGVKYGGTDVSLDGPKLVAFTVYPRPRIFNVSPGLGPIYGGTTITVHGAFFGSEYSRGYLATVYSGITVYVGDNKCGNVTYVGDSDVVCQTPPGIGATSVSLHIEENGLLRSVIFDRGFKYSILYFVGMMSTVNSSGYFGVGPSSSRPGTYHNPGASLEKSSIQMSKSASTLLSVDGAVYIGGVFEFADGKEVNNVLMWDGTSSVVPLGYGTDAAVNTLTTFEGKVVVGGDFQRVFTEGGKALTSPLVAFWDGSQWLRVGDLVLAGSVSVAVTNGDALYIGGQFSSYGVAGFHGLAKYSGGLWEPIDGGVGEGKVLAISFVGEDMLVGGNFLQAGGVTAKNLARWDTRSWSAMGDFNGEVTSIASIGEFLFVGGEFTSVSGIAANRIVSYQLGSWYPLRSGLSGRVNSLLPIGACLYLGGDFTRTIAEPDTPVSSKDLPYAARWCLDLVADTTPTFEALLGFEGMGPVRDMVYSYNEAMHYTDKWVCPLDTNTTHCIYPLKV